LASNVFLSQFRVHLPGLDRRIGLALASVLLIASVFVLALRLLSSTPLNIYINNSGGVTVQQIPGLFTFSDMMVVLVSAAVAGASFVYILLWKGGEVTLATDVHSNTLLQASMEEKRKAWEQLAPSLGHDERKVYEAVLDAGGFLGQSELVQKVSLSKTTVSRSLDILESRGLLERRRRGMSNVVVLK
jgi:uncharacterized membrane protein